MSALKVNLDLIRKYNVPGPRYTSYPPATHFSAAVTRESILERLRSTRETDRPVSLYFHLPFCWSLCWFCGCTTVITNQQARSETYLRYLETELDLMAPYLRSDREVVQIHFGGGTPTFLLPEEIRQLGNGIQSRFRLGDDLEAGVEIDPRRLTLEHITALREAGFNRASLGVQDYDPKVQQAIHRIQPREQTEQAVQWAREAGFRSVNIDLIYGLPFQTTESFERTLSQVLELRPDRFAIFSYAHVPWIKPAQNTFKETMLPSVEMKFEILKLIVEKLTSRGYAYIGMDHFALENDELAVAQRQKTLQRNFQGYSTRGGADIYAFGMSSISQADGIYWQNEKELPAYYGKLDQGELPLVKGYVLNDDDKIRRQTIMRLMCDLSLDYSQLSEALGINFTHYFSSELESLDDLEDDGLLERHASGLEVTDLGRLLIRILAMRFDAYLPANREGRYSKAI